MTTGLWAVRKADGSLMRAYGRIPALFDTRAEARNYRPHLDGWRVVRVTVHVEVEHG